MDILALQLGSLGFQDDVQVVLLLVVPSLQPVAHDQGMK